MTELTDFCLGRVNANEDFATVVSVDIDAGSIVESQRLLMVVETTKSAVEIVAPSVGVIEHWYVAVGDEVKVGDLVCRAKFEDSAVPLTLERNDQGGSRNEHRESDSRHKISLKARKRAEQLGVDLAGVIEIYGDSTVEHVEKYAASQSRAVSTISESLASGRFDKTFGKRAFIFGAGGHAASLLSMIQDEHYILEGVIDNKLQDGELAYSLLHKLGSNYSDVNHLIDVGLKTAFVGVGGTIDNSPRQKVFSKLKAAGCLLPSLVSNAAKVDPSCTIGEGSYILPGATVGARVSIGNNVIVNQGAIICHDTVVEDHCHIAPGAIIAGHVSLGQQVTVGMGVAIMDRVSVGSFSLIHNLASVAQNLSENVEFSRDGVIKARVEKHS